MSAEGGFEISGTMCITGIEDDTDDGLVAVPDTMSWTNRRGRRHKRQRPPQSVGPFALLLLLMYCHGRGAGIHRWAANGFRFRPLSTTASFVVGGRPCPVSDGVDRSEALLLFSFSSHRQRGEVRSLLMTTKTSSSSKSTTSQNEIPTIGTIKTRTPPLYLATWFGLLLATTTCALPADALVPVVDQGEAQGIPLVTRSELGQSVRSTVVGGAQLVDRLDLKWERFSDSLRDESKCDPRTNRRLFDNGTRRDGTKIGNPVLGSLCTPEPLRSLNPATSTAILNTAEQSAFATVFKNTNVDADALAKKRAEIENLVGPSFTRAITAAGTSAADADEEASKRREFNRDLYVQMRAIGELTTATTATDGGTQEGAIGSNEKHLQTAARALERDWGDRLIARYAPAANRDDYASPFPRPDDTEDQPYDEGALLDALGKVSVVLTKLQADGLIGRWEISIPDDDDWNVVTIAVDDDISLGAQILARERNQPLWGSEVVASVRSAMETHARIPYKLDAFFIDPTTTRQELYNPTQLLISLSDLGQ